MFEVQTLAEEDFQQRDTNHMLVFSSPEPKAFIIKFCPESVELNLFTSSHQDPQYQFQPVYLRVNGIQFFLRNYIPFGFQGEIITK